MLMGITWNVMLKGSSPHMHAAPTDGEIPRCWYLDKLVILQVGKGTYVCIAGSGEAQCGGAITWLHPSLCTMGHCIEATSIPFKIPFN